MFAFPGDGQALPPYWAPRMMGDSRRARSTQIKARKRFGCWPSPTARGAADYPNVPTLSFTPENVMPS